MKTALTIAGSDSSGGAGIQADIKTMCANGVFAMSAITALTAQNTCGVTDIMEASPQFLKEQLDCIFTDIRPDAVKIGMVSSGALIETIADSLKQHGAERIVVDPVMAATSGARLIDEEAIATLKERLLPLAMLITPNIPEAQILSKMEIHDEADMVQAARHIQQRYSCSVLIKGGHQINDANDYLQTADHGQWFYGKRIDNPIPTALAARSPVPSRPIWPRDSRWMKRYGEPRSISAARSARCLTWARGADRWITPLTFTAASWRKHEAHVVI